MNLKKPSAPGIFRGRFFRLFFALPHGSAVPIFLFYMSALPDEESTTVNSSTILPVFASI